MAEENLAAQRQTAVTAYFTSKQLLLFALIWHCLSGYFLGLHLLHNPVYSTSSHSNATQHPVNYPVQVQSDGEVRVAG